MSYSLYLCEGTYLIRLDRLEFPRFLGRSQTTKALHLAQICYFCWRKHMNTVALYECQSYPFPKRDDH